MVLMFSKIYDQIFDSSIAVDFMVRHVFMDLLVLADKDGVVDMTTDAVARRTNVPFDTVAGAIEKLGQPDPDSRSKAKEGRRIIPLDSRRNWGWIIVNYEHYRKIRDDEGRRAYFRDHKRKYREKLSKTKCGQSTSPQKVTDGHRNSTHAEADSDAEADSKKERVKYSKQNRPTRDELMAFVKEVELPTSDGEWLWFKWESNGWTNNGSPIKNWKGTVQAWKAAGFMASQKSRNGFQPKPEPKMRELK